MSNMTERQTISSGTHWEAMAGYSRAIRYGNQVFVAGTTATDADGNIVGRDDPAEQTRFILQKIEAALKAAGASLKDVVRTRVYVVNIEQWEPVARVHGEVFAEIRPANTLLAIDALVGPGYLVEIEADAIIGAGDAI
ncbi:MAG: RidA family protein [Chloroflexota bacterium]